MKLLLILTAIVTGLVFYSSKPEEITGVWVLDTSVKGTEAAVLRVQMAEGYLAGKLDIPAQEVYDKTVYIQVEKEKVSVFLDRNKTTYIEGKINGAVIEGQSFVNGRSEPVRFRRVKG